MTWAVVLLLSAFAAAACAAAADDEGGQQLLDILSGKTKLDPKATQIAVMDGDQRAKCRALVFYLLGSHTCYKLEDGDVSDRIAIQLLNCEITEYGRHAAYECPDPLPVRACTNSTVMSAEDFGHFTLIRRDLEEQCKQAMDTLSRLAMHDTVHRLTDHAQQQLLALKEEHNSLAQVTEAMVDSVQSGQLAILQNQEALKGQVAAAATQLSTTINYSVVQNEQLLQEQRLVLAGQEAVLLLTGNVRTALDDAHSRLVDVRRVMDEQQMSTMRAFQDIQSGVEMVLAIVGYTGSNVNFLVSLMFYTMALVVAYLITTPRRAASARFWIFLLLSAEMALERIYIENADWTEGEQRINQALWVLRQLAVAISLVVLAWAAVTYVSPEQKIASAMASQLDSHRQALGASISASISALFASRGGPDSADYDDPEHDPDQDEDQDQVVEIRPASQLAAEAEAEAEAAAAADEDWESLAEEEAADIAEEEQFLEYASDEEPEAEDLAALQADVSPLLNYRLVAGKQLRPVRPVLRNPVADRETPDAFLLSVEIWRRVCCQFSYLFR